MSSSAFSLSFSLTLKEDSRPPGPLVIIFIARACSAVRSQRGINCSPSSPSFTKSRISENAMAASSLSTLSAVMPVRSERCLMSSEM